MHQQAISDLRHSK